MRGVGLRRPPPRPSSGDEEVVGGEGVAQVTDRRIGGVKPRESDHES